MLYEQQQNFERRYLRLCFFLLQFLRILLALLFHSALPSLFLSPQLPKFNVLILSCNSVFVPDYFNGMLLLRLQDSWKMKNKEQVSRGGSSTSCADMSSRKMEIKSIMKDIEFLGSTHMTWKEKKELENKKVVYLGGKPPKKQRLPLSVARVMMKKQKDREEKMKEENMILGRFGSNITGVAGKEVERRRPEHRVLKSSEGHFRNGVLDVKHLLQPSAPGVTDDIKHGVSKGKKKKGGKKKRGKKNGAGRRH